MLTKSLQFKVGKDMELNIVGLNQLAKSKKVDANIVHVANTSLHRVFTVTAKGFDPDVNGYLATVKQITDSLF